MRGVVMLTEQSSAISDAVSNCAAWPLYHMIASLYTVCRAASVKFTLHGDVNNANVGVLCC